MSKTNVVEFAKYNKKTAQDEAFGTNRDDESSSFQVDLTDDEIRAFFKVVDRLRNTNKGTPNTATLDITDEEVKIETRHYGTVEQQGMVDVGSILCLAAIVELPEAFNEETMEDCVEDFKIALKGVSFE